MKRPSIIALILILTSLSALAGTKTWVGGGGNKYWNNVGNWDVNAIPVDGDTVYFDTAAGKTTNNLPGNPSLGLNFLSSGNSIYGDGTTLHLSGLTNRLYLNPGTNHIYSDVKLDNDLRFDAAYGVNNSSLFFEGDVNLGIYTLTVTNSSTAGSQVEFSGVIKGTGNFIKQGSQGVTFSGSADNTYSGTTTVENGILYLNKSLSFLGKVAVPGELIIGPGISPSVSYLHGGQLADTSKVTIDSGVFDLNGFNDTIKSLVLLNGGLVMTDDGTLTVDDFINCPRGLSASSIKGNLELDAAGGHTINVGTNSLADYTVLDIEATITGGGGIVKTGNGRLTLYGTNTVAGVFTNAAGTTSINADDGFGATNDPVFVTGGLLSVNSFIQNKPLSLQYPGALGGFGKWSGNITNIGTPTIDLASTNLLTLSGIISGSGFNLDGVSDCALYLAGKSNNIYAGPVTIKTGTLLLGKDTNVTAVTGTLVIGDGVDFGNDYADAARVQLARPGQISDVAPVTVHSDGTLDLNGWSETITNLTLYGSVTTSNGVLTLAGSLTAESSTFNQAVITGNLSLGNSQHTFTVNDGSANMDLDLKANLSSTGANGGFTKDGAGELWISGTNTHAGLTTVAAGKMLVHGVQTVADIVVRTNAMLGGTGVVGLVTNYGTLFPGNYNSTTGAVFTAGNVLSVNGKFSFDFGTLGSTNHDVLVVNALLLTNTALEIFDRVNAPISVGSTQILVTRTAGGAFGGTFTGVPDYSGISSTNRSFLASYQAGNGNDFALTPYVHSVVPATSSQLTSLGNGGFQFNASAANGVLYALLTSTNLTLPMTNWSVITNVIPSGGNIQVRVTNSVVRPQQFYRLRTL